MDIKKLSHSITGSRGLKIDSVYQNSISYIDAIWIHLQTTVHVINTCIQQIILFNFLICGLINKAQIIYKYHFGN